MEFRSRPEDGVGMPASLGYNPPPIRASAFSKPLLPPSSSLLSPPRVVGEGAGSRNGTGLATNTASSVFDPPIATATTDHPLRSHVIDPEPAPTVISSPSAASSGGGSLVGGLNSTATKSSTASAEAAPKYRECLRNHAASLGGHVLDGCGEFMPGGDAGTPDALKCAACGCHRSFHRKEVEGDRDYYRFNNGSPSPSPHHHAGRGRVPLLLPPPPLHHPQPQHHPQYHMHAPSPSGVVPGSSAAVGFGGNYSGSGGATTESSSEEHAGAQPRPPPGAVLRKRFRTKFTPEQKEKMLAFAERVGWRIQKQDEAVVEQFCTDLGIRRQVLKVWMHNNKHNIRRQQQQQDLQQQQQQQDLQQQQQQQDLQQQQQHQ